MEDTLIPNRMNTNESGMDIKIINDGFEFEKVLIADENTNKSENPSNFIKIEMKPDFVKSFDLEKNMEFSHQVKEETVDYDSINKAYPENISTICEGLEDGIIVNTLTAGSDFQKEWVIEVYDKTCDHSIRTKQDKILQYDKCKSRAFKCDICYMRFPCKKSLEAHMMIHTGIKPFKCDICDASFRSKVYLKTHSLRHSQTKYKNSGSKLFNPKKQHLKKHIITHAGNEFTAQTEKPFQCDMCEKRYTHKSNLTSHLMTHVTSKPFKCDICGSCFKRKQHLQTHINLHTRDKPFKCDKCEASFSQKTYLEKHVTAHTRNKPFKCDICNKYFTRKSNLQSHNTTHLGVKPFNCDLCPASFSRKSYLKCHQLRHM